MGEDRDFGKEMPEAKSIVGAVEAFFNSLTIPETDQDAETLGFLSNLQQNHLGLIFIFDDLETKVARAVILRTSKRDTFIYFGTGVSGKVFSVTNPDIFSKEFFPRKINPENTTYRPDPERLWDNILDYYPNQLKCEFSIVLDEYDDPKLFNQHLIEAVKHEADIYNEIQKSRERLNNSRSSLSDMLEGVI